METGEIIQVLIVDDVAETRENLRKLLQFENDIEVVGAASTGNEGIDLAKDIRPDVVIMDINMPDIDGISATDMIRKEIPHTQIVILSVQGDSNYMRQAMLAGARDFLTKPPSLDELTSAIRRAGEMAINERNKVAPQVLVAGGNGIGRLDPSVSLGKVIVAYSPKGGTGCTTIAINLALALHNEETPIAIVDGNMQFGDVAIFLNEQGRNSVADLAIRADELDPQIIEEVHINHKKSGVKLYPAPQRPEYGEDITGDQFGKVINYLRRFYSYVIVDTPSTLTDVVISALDSCDVILLLTTQEIPSLKNSRLFLDLANVLEIERERILFVMNRYDKRIGITPEKVSENFKHKIVSVLPLDEQVVIPSVNRGVPFILGDKSRPISRAVLSLAESVRQTLTSKSEEEMKERQLAGVSSTG